MVLLSKRSITPSGGRELENTLGAGSPIIVCPKRAYCSRFRIESVLQFGVKNFVFLFFSLHSFSWLYFFNCVSSDSENPL